MKKIGVSLFLFFVLISISACSSTTISTQRLKADILGLEDLALVTKINEMSIISKVENTTQLEYKISTVVQSYNYTSAMDITLVYTKTDGVWAASDHKIDLISISAKNDPSVAAAVKSAIKEVSDGLIDHQALIGKDQTYTLVSSTGSKETGSMILVIGEVFADDYLKYEAKYTVEAIFDYHTGWGFILKDWVYNETMIWSGMYDLTWTKSVPGYPGGAISKDFVEGDQIKNLWISGEALLLKRMDKSETITNSLLIQFTFKDIFYEFLPVIDNPVESISFNFNKSDPSSTISIRYQPINRAYTDPQYVPFQCDQPFMNGSLVRQS